MLSHHHIAALFRMIPDPVWLKDPHGVYLAGNARFEELYGVQEAELIGKTDYDFVPAAEADSFRLHDLAALVAKGPTRNEEWLTFAVGGYRGLFETIKTPLADVQGNVLGIIGIARDITAMKEVEKKLQQSEQQYLSLLNNTPAILYRYSKRRGGLYYSTSVEAFLGYTPQDLAGHPLLWHDSIYSEDLPLVDAALSDLQAGKAFDLEYRIHDRSGARHWFHDRSISHCLEDGELIVDGIAEDITRRKQAEEELQAERRMLARRVEERTEELKQANRILLREIAERERTMNILRESEMHSRTLEQALRDSEERWHFAVDGSDLGLWDWNLATGEVFYSSHWKRMLGYDDHDIQDCAEEFYRRIHPDDLPRLQQVMEEQYAPTTNHYCCEFRMATKDGGWRWIASKGKVVARDDAGAPVRMLGTHADITERKHADERIKTSEALLQSVMAGTTDAIFVKDTAGRIMFANPVTLEIFGSSAEELHGRTAGECFTDPDIGQALEANDQRIMTSGCSEMVEETLATPHGVRHFLTTKSPRHDADGNVIGLIGIARDITERKRTEKAQAEQKHHDRLNMELVLAGARERRRVSSVLHDQIGQNLLLQKLKLRMLEDSLSTSPELELLSEIREILDETISSVRSLTVQLCPPILTTLGLIAALEWLGKKFKTDFNLSVTFTDDGAQKPLDQEQREVVYQAIRELLINVTKHAGTDRAELAVARDGNFLVAVVADQGCGGTFTVKSGVTSGEGYGLYFIRQNIEHFGGQITVTSEPGHGTKVTLFFPLTGT